MSTFIETLIHKWSRDDLTGQLTRTCRACDLVTAHNYLAAPVVDWALAPCARCNARIEAPRELNSHYCTRVRAAIERGEPVPVWGEHGDAATIGYPEVLKWIGEQGRRAEALAARRETEWRNS